MNVALALLVLLVSSNVQPQSGRKGKVVRIPPPTVEEAASKNANTTPGERPPVTAEKNQDYRCTNDETLARIIEERATAEQIFTSKEVDEKANITSRPKPAYTREARRAGIQGYVIVRVALLSTGEVGPVRVIRGLPAGLTENAIRAACKIRFKPAQKGGQPVSQFMNVEYGFRLADSSILGP
jgi:periplasmic protein TonB